MMQEVQETLLAFEHRVDTIKKRLRTSLLSNEDREKLEDELQDIKKNMSNLETSLKNLHRENSKTFAFAVLLMFFSFLSYGLYKMSINQS